MEVLGPLKQIDRKRQYDVIQSYLPVPEDSFLGNTLYYCSSGFLIGFPMGAIWAFLDFYSASDKKLSECGSAALTGGIIFSGLFSVFMGFSGVRYLTLRDTLLLSSFGSIVALANGLRNFI